MFFLVGLITIKTRILTHEQTYKRKSKHSHTTHLVVIQSSSPFSGHSLSGNATRKKTDTTLTGSEWRLHRHAVIQQRTELENYTPALMQEKLSNCKVSRGQLILTHPLKANVQDYTVRRSLMMSLLLPAILRHYERKQHLVISDFLDL